MITLVTHFFSWFFTKRVALNMLTKRTGQRVEGCKNADMADKGGLAKCWHWLKKGWRGGLDPPHFWLTKCVNCPLMIAWSLPWVISFCPVHTTRVRSCNALELLTWEKTYQKACLSWQKACQGQILDLSWIEIKGEKTLFKKIQPKKQIRPIKPMEQSLTNNFLTKYEYQIIFGFPK